MVRNPKILGIFPMKAKRKLMREETNPASEPAELKLRLQSIRATKCPTSIDDIKIAQSIERDLRLKQGFVKLNIAA